MTTGWVWDERYAWHDTGRWTSGWYEPIQHPENGETKRRFRNLVERSGLLAQLTPVAPRPATREEVLRVHAAEYLDGLARRSAQGGGDAGDGETPFGTDSVEIAMLAAGGTIAAVEATLGNEVDNAYALVRPPGHHAGPDYGMGFCLINNVAIAAQHAVDALGAERVAIVDWDVHHGNGTQAIFYDDPRVLFISLHQDQCFPADSGTLEERGSGDGVGATINIPLPAASGAGAYLSALERVVIPALRRHRPQLLIVSNGLDAGGMDPLARQLLTSDAYRQMSALMLETAGELCDGNLVIVHEGGYSPAHSPFLGLGVVEGLTGIRTEVVDPYVPDLARLPEQELLPHHEQAVAAAAAAAGLDDQG
jgi:acetoin utilization deacetylase AcuC-like enzyme